MVYHSRYHYLYGVGGLADVSPAVMQEMLRASNAVTQISHLTSQQQNIVDTISSQQNQVTTPSGSPVVSAGSAADFDCAIAALRSQFNITDAQVTALAGMYASDPQAFASIMQQYGITVGCRPWYKNPLVWVGVAAGGAALFAAWKLL